MSPALIEVADLAMRFPTGRMALNGAAMSLAAGELVVILGANGCGKSTMLRCIAGMLRPTGGEVRVGGRVISGLSGRALGDARMALGMIFQNAQLVKRRSVVANVLTGTLGRHRTLSVALGRLPRGETPHAMACLDEVGLAHFAPQRAGTLSGGQAQRVSVARALAQRPRALLADEPVASLDPEAADDLMGLLRRVAHQEGLGVLCVLHQPELAKRYADRVLGMQAGRIVFDSLPQQMRESDVANLYVKQPVAERLAA
jgi:phosphonate transport system ATP-binding protein